MNNNDLSKNGFNVIKPEQILFCKAQGCCTKILLNDKTELILNKRLNIVEKDLTPNDFFRCHNSFIVNVNYVEQVEENICKLKESDEIISISRRKKTKFKKKLKEKYFIIIK